MTGDPVLKLGITNFADVEIALSGYQKDRTTIGLNKAAPDLVAYLGLSMRF